MIVLNLECETCKVSFEGWFDSLKDFSKQNNKKLINCPSCNSPKIKKNLVAPNVSKKSNSKDRLIKKSIASDISKIRKVIEKNFEYVGEDFTEEAKKIKYGERKDRSIYGEATIEQTKELIDEDIDVVPLPFNTKKTN